MVVAKKYNAILLTGDRYLRGSAKKEDVEIRGILWILDELIDHEVIDTNKSTVSLRKILECGSYLPKRECKLRFEKWK